MPAECVLSLGTSDVIAVLAGLVAALSALYAGRAAGEAKRANELALLSHRKAIYDAFYELKMHMEQRRLRPDMGQVSKFYYPSRDAAFYVSKSLSSEIVKYYELCFKVADQAMLGNGLYPNESEELKCAYKQACVISEAIDHDLKAVVKKYVNQWGQVLHSIIYDPR